jgi:hypothetical protein
MKYNPPTLKEELSLMREKPIPYSYSFSKNNKHLLIFGLMHTKNDSHPQFEAIKEALKNFNPEVALFEIPKEAEEWITSDNVLEAKKRIGEIKIIANILPSRVNKVPADNNVTNIDEIEGFSEKGKFILKLLMRARSVCRGNDVSLEDFLLGELSRNNKMELLH